MLINDFQRKQLKFQKCSDILSNVAKPAKTKVLKGFSPIPGVRSYTCSICLPQHSSDVHASMSG